MNQWQNKWHSSIKLEYGNHLAVKAHSIAIAIKWRLFLGVSHNIQLN